MLCTALACGDDNDNKQQRDNTTAVTTSRPPDSTGATTSIATVGEPTSSSSEALPPVGYDDDIQGIWNANCTCHLEGVSGTMTAPFLKLNSGSSHAELVAVVAMETALDRVAPGVLDDSYLWHKLNDTHLSVGGKGDKMPPATILSDEKIELIRAWILQGALE